MALENFDGNGVRFALDTTYNLEYKITFKDGKPIDIRFFGDNKDFDAMVESGGFTAVDDSVAANRNDADENPKNGNKIVDFFRPVYNICLKLDPVTKALSIEDTQVEEQKIDAPLPAHHVMGYAFSAREKNMVAPPLTVENIKAYMLELIASGKMVSNVNLPTKPAPAPIKKPSRRAGEPVNVSRPGVSDAALESALMKYGIDLTQRARQGRLDPVIGRDTERVEVRQRLLRKKRPSVMLLGEAGIGKTALAEAIAQDIADGVAEAELKNARLISLDLQAMNAGTQYRGMFEERLMPILKGLEERGGYFKGQKVILFMDEIHSALTAGNAQGGTNAGQIMKPYLSGDSLTCIAATTKEEFKKHLEKDEALTRRFEPYNLEPPSKEDTMLILKRLYSYYGYHHSMDETNMDDMVEYIVRMTERFMPTRHQPDKSIGVMDDAMTAARAEGSTKLEVRHIITAVSKATGLKKEFLNQQDFDRYLNLETNLGQRVIGQDQAKRDVVQDLIAGRSGLTKEKAPRLVAVFPGPTGVGKTELAKALAEEVMGNEDALVRIDMAKYQENHTVSGLIGAPPGYGGSDEEGELTKAVREKPYSIVLLDEIEKAHPDVFKTMLSVFDDGELKDNKGRPVDFTNTVIIMTTNLGSKEIQAKLNGDTIGFADPNIDKDDVSVNNADIEKISRDAIEKFFPPEIVNRVDGVYPFFPLTKDEVVKILDLRIADVQKNLRECAQGLQLTNCTLEIGPDVKAALAEAGYSKKFGARNLERPLRKKLQGPLGHWMMRNRDMLKDLNAKGKFKITLTKLGDEFNPQAVPMSGNDNSPASKLADKMDKLNKPKL